MVPTIDYMCVYTITHAAMSRMYVTLFTGMRVVCVCVAYMYVCVYVCVCVCVCVCDLLFCHKAFNRQGLHNHERFCHQQSATNLPQPQ